LDEKWFLFFGVGGESWQASSAVHHDAEVHAFFHDHLEETVFSPVGTPGVSSDPVLSTVLNAPSDNSDLVVDLWVWVFLGVNSTGVSFKFVVSMDTA
jgi:hypothetical protein